MTPSALVIRDPVGPCYTQNYMREGTIRFLLSGYATTIVLEERLNAEFLRKEEDLKRMDPLGITPTGATGPQVRAHLDEISTEMDKLSDDARGLIERIIAIGSKCERCSEPSTELIR